jgi:hypothetical protein
LKLRDLLIVGAIVLLAGLAAFDALVGDGDPDGAGSATGEASQTDTGEVGRPDRFEPIRAPGSLVFLDGSRCQIRQVVTSSGDELPLEPIETACELWAPPRGVRIAYRVGGTVAEAVPFRFRDLNHPRVDLGGYRAQFGAIAWSPDGQRAAWCESARLGFDFAISTAGVPVPTDGCPREYTEDGRPIVLSGRRAMADGEALLTATGRIGLLHRGVDGSYSTLVDGNRFERYEGSRLREVRPVRPSVAGASLSLSPDNCALLANREGVVALVDLGCFRGGNGVTTVSPDNCVDRDEAVKSECARYPAPRAFLGTAAAWSPDGEWIAVAEENAVAFHRVVGRYTVIRWPSEPRAVAWIG